MKHISILVPFGHSSLVNIEGTHQVFNQVNGLLANMKRPPIFKVDLVGLEKTATQTNGLFTVNPNKLVGDIQKTDLIIVPAVHGNQKKVYEQNKAFEPFLLKQYKEGAEIASLCVGAFLLAHTGLLNGKQCATHWIHAHEFRKMFPEVHLVDDKIMTEDRGIYTSGGAYSYLNLLLYLIEKFAGREIAILISKAFMIDMDKNSQSPFIIFRGQREHEDQTVITAQEYIEQHYREKISIEDLSNRFAISRRSLERRFKNATCNTIAEYIQRVKVEAAKKALESGRKNVNEVMYEVGYLDEKAFRSTFKKFTGISPVQYRNKYNREMAVV